MDCGQSEEVGQRRNIFVNNFIFMSQAQEQCVSCDWWVSCVNKQLWNGRMGRGRGGGGEINKKDYRSLSQLSSTFGRM